MRVLDVLDAEIARAQSAAVKTASAADHSLRDAAGKAVQVATAKAARARLDAMLHARVSIVRLMHAAGCASLDDAVPMDHQVRLRSVLDACNGEGLS